MRTREAVEALRSKVLGYVIKAFLLNPLQRRQRDRGGGGSGGREGHWNNTLLQWYPGPSQEPSAHQRPN